MNSKKYPVNNYVPKNLQKTDRSKDNFHDLDTRLKQMTFDEIVQDPDYHFENSFGNNFDLIHHQCRGDSLKFSRKYYETIYSSDLKENLLENDLRKNFVSSAIKSERKDLHLEKQVAEKHFKKDLKKNGIFFIYFKKESKSKKDRRL